MRLGPAGQLAAPRRSPWARRGSWGPPPNLETRLFLFCFGCVLKLGCLFWLCSETGLFVCVGCVPKLGFSSVRRLGLFCCFVLLRLFCVCLWFGSRFVLFAQVCLLVCSLQGLGVRRVRRA